MCSSLFWGMQLLTHGSVLETLCLSVGPDTQANGMTADQVILAWSLVLIQGVRRLLETSLLGRSSGSKMWFVHWLLGIAFYLALGVSCWIEGAGMLQMREAVTAIMHFSDHPNISRRLNLHQICHFQHYPSRTESESDHWNSSLYPSIRYPARLPCLPRITTKVHTSDTSHISELHLPSLHCGMPNLSFLGIHSCA